MNEKVKSILATLVIALVIGIGGSQPGFAKKPDNGGGSQPAPKPLVHVSNPVADEYIVVLPNSTQSNKVSSAVQALAQEYFCTTLGTLNGVSKAGHMRCGPTNINSMLYDSRISYVSENGLLPPALTQSNPGWALDVIDNSVNLTLDNLYTYGRTGSGVNAYVIDTGINTGHTEFTGRIGNGFAYDGGSLTDSNGHGTFVAGLIGGTTYGAAKGVTLHPVRVTDATGNATIASALAGINWVAANRVAPAVAYFSFSTLVGTGPFPLSDAINASTGITWVLAAGNNSADACGYDPAANANAVVVGSFGQTYTTSAVSNYGPCVTLYAPGENITSAWFTSPTATMSGGDGTSAAAAYAAGTAAMILQQVPSASQAQVRLVMRDSAGRNELGVLPGSFNRRLYSNVAGDGVNHAPFADLTVNCDVSTMRCDFDGRMSIDLENGPVTWHWYFSDTNVATGGKSSSSNPTYDFNVLVGPTLCDCYYFELDVYDNTGIATVQDNHVTQVFRYIKRTPPTYSVLPWSPYPQP